MIEPAHSDYGKTSSVLEFDEMVTPYAFTDIQLTLSSDIIVDRFGKKGLFRADSKKYIIPCDYDEILYTGFGKYKVTKADFTGVIEVGNEMKWIEKLHREE